MWKNRVKSGLLPGLLICLLSSSLVACSPPQAQTLEAQITAATAPTDQSLQVSGQSNLPDQALILVALIDPQQEAAFNRNVIVQEFAQVKDGKFATTLKPLKPVNPGAYKVRLSFRPDSHDPSGGKITQAVGPKGEQLHGPLVQSDGDVKILVKMLDWNVK